MITSTTPRLTTPVTTCVCIGSTATLITDLERLAQIAGVDIVVVSPHDDPPPTVLTLTESSPTSVIATFNATFHPGLAGQEVLVNPREQPGDLLELFVAAGATGRGTVIGVVGLHGGAGATITAMLLARHLAAETSVGFVDADPLSRSVPILADLDSSGKRWADVAAEHGTLLPGRLADALPRWKEVIVMTGDDRSGTPLGRTAHQVTTALAQAVSTTIVDLPRSVLGTATEWTSICDHLVAVTGHHLPNLATAKALLATMPPIPRTVVVSGAPSIGAAQDCGEQLETDVLCLRRERSLLADIAHNLTPGDRTSARARRDIARIARAVTS